MAFGAAAAMVAAQRRRRQRHPTPKTLRVASALADHGDQPVSLGGRIGRQGEVAKVGARMGVGYGLHQAKRTFASAARKEALDEEFQLRSAEQVTETLGNLKGALMKLGQMASYLDLGLPEPMRQALTQLQAGAPPMAPELATATLVEAFGKPVDDLFAEWDPVAIASASIGQVHRAMTLDGRAVAVKVQYPGVAEAMASDLQSADVLFAALSIMFPGLDAKPLVEELRERLLEELDYDLERANQQLFADYYRGHPFIHVPDTLPELSNARVLTSELVVGRSFNELRDAPEAERQHAAEAIYRYVMRSLYCLHAFNGDPHPGNYLFGDDGRVAFLDYGLVKRFTAEEITLFREMHQAIVIDRDAGAYRRLIEGAGLIAAGAPVSDDRIGGYFGGFYEHLALDEPTEVSREFAAALVERIFDTDGPNADVQRLANVPPSFVVIQRINLGLYALLADLGAKANWRAITHDIVPWVDLEPSTPMGEAEAKWLADNPRPDRVA
jgi:predicted unusual protein kinase regulating ubiquinone biosynthesis (AarF/ABC1/UbiB family)